MDWNKDGKLDLVAGDSPGSVWIFLNEGTRKKPVLAKGVKVEADGKVIKATKQTYRREGEVWIVDKTIPGSHALAKDYTKLHFADWNGDGLEDLLVGSDHDIILYANVGKRSEPEFAAPVKIAVPGGRFPVRPSPYVIDWDGDGVLDLLVGCESPEVMIYRNVGTATEPKLAKGVKLDLEVPKELLGYRWRLDVTDWNNDGKRDLLVGNIYGNRGTRRSGGHVWLFLGN